jgi:DNA-binding NarL/FixJ family response regulator
MVMLGAMDVSKAGRPLTDRENEVFRLIVNEGLDNHEISNRLGMAVRTVKFHAGNILDKFGVPDRCKLAIAFWSSKLEARGRPRLRRPSRRR